MGHIPRARASTLGGVKYTESPGSQNRPLRATLSARPALYDAPIFHEKDPNRSHWSNSESCPRASGRTNSSFLAFPPCLSNDILVDQLDYQNCFGGLSREFHQPGTVEFPTQTECPALESMNFSPRLFLRRVIERSPGSTFHLNMTFLSISGAVLYSWQQPGTPPSNSSGIAVFVLTSAVASTFGLSSSFIANELSQSIRHFRSQTQNSKPLNNAFIASIVVSWTCTLFAWAGFIGSLLLLVKSTGSHMAFVASMTIVSIILACFTSVLLILFYYVYGRRNPEELSTLRKYSSN